MVVFTTAMFGAGISSGMNQPGPKFAFTVLQRVRRSNMTEQQRGNIYFRPSKNIDHTSRQPLNPNQPHFTLFRLVSPAPAMTHAPPLGPDTSTVMEGSTAPSDSSRVEDREKIEHDTQEHHVDVQEAEKTFNALARKLSKRSESSGSTAALGKQKDAEKGDEVDNRFDLREYLTSSNDANQRAGLKHKVCRTLISRGLLVKILFSALASYGRTFRWTLVEGQRVRCVQVCQNMLAIV